MNDTSEQCPLCGSLKVLAGDVVSGKNYGFKPADTKKGFFMTLRSPFAFRFGPAAHFCAACGMVWSKADPQDAAEFLENYVTDETQGRLAAIDAATKEASDSPSSLNGGK